MRIGPSFFSPIRQYLVLPLIFLGRMPMMTRGLSILGRLAAPTFVGAACFSWVDDKPVVLHPAVPVPEQLSGDHFIRSVRLLPVQAVAA